MFATCKELLWRQRQIEVFPCDHHDTLMSMLPDHMQDIVGVGDDALKWHNLGRCCNRARNVIVELKGEAGYAFWMKFEWDVVSPNDGTSFILPESNANYETIKDWWDRATKIQSELSVYQDILWAFFTKADHPLLVKKHWPELHQFVDFVPSLAHEEPNLNKRRVIPLPPSHEKDGIINTLAGSTLLPSYECRAWVDYEVER